MKPNTALYLSATFIACLASRAHAESITDVLSGFNTIRNTRPDIVSQNLQDVKDIMQGASAGRRAAAIRDDTTYSTSGIAGPALGGIKAGNIDGTGYGVNDQATAVANAAKAAFNNPRPFVVDPSIHPLVGAGGTSFPSGHTTKGFADSLYLAYTYPERFQQILTRASEYAENRIINGVHYPLDVIAGRMAGEFTFTNVLASNPGLTQSVMTTATSARQYTLSIGNGQSMAQIAASGSTDRFSNDAANKADWERRMTYGLSTVGPSGQAAVVPENAELLLATRLPYLTRAQIRDVIATTERSSGEVLDNGNGWERVDLYKAADGYGAFNQSVTVNMDASRAADQATPGAGFNAADTWKNDIGGPGSLTKTGTGSLTLAGTNSFSGGTSVEGGTVVAGSQSALGTGGVSVRDGTLSIGASRVDVLGDLTMGPLGKLDIGGFWGSLTIGEKALFDPLSTLELDLDHEQLGLWKLVGYGSHSGAFGTVLFDNNDARFSESLIYGSDAVYLSVSQVPLPSSAPLFGVSLLALSAIGYGMKMRLGASA